MHFSAKPTLVSKLLLTTAAIIVILVGINWASVILQPFLLSVFIAIICQPLIKKMAYYGIPKGIAITLVVIMVVTFGLTFAGIVAQSFNQFSQDIPLYKTQLKTEFEWFADQAANYNVYLNKQFIVEHFDPGVAMSLATDFLSGFSNVMAYSLLILLTSVFILIEASSLKKKLHVALDDPAMHIKKIETFLVSVKNYLAIKTVVSLMTGLLAGILSWAIGVDYFILWGVLAFMLNYIPTIGSIIAAIPVVLLALLQVGAGGAGTVAIGYLMINTVMGNVIEPKYMGKGLGLSTLVVFLSLIFWGWLLGTVGMLLSVPLTMVVKIALESNDETQWMAVLLSSGDEVEEVVDKVVSQETRPESVS